MFAEQLGADEVTQPVGLTVQEASQAAQKSTIMIALGSVAVFYLIYRFLIK